VAEVSRMISIIGPAMAFFMPPLLLVFSMQLMKMRPMELFISAVVVAITFLIAN